MNACESRSPNHVFVGLAVRQAGAELRRLSIPSRLVQPPLQDARAWRRGCSYFLLFLASRFEQFDQRWDRRFVSVRRGTTLGFGRREYVFLGEKKVECCKLMNENLKMGLTLNSLEFRLLE